MRKTWIVYNNKKKIRNIRNKKKECCAVAVWMSGREKRREHSEAMTSGHSLNLARNTQIKQL